MTLVGIAFCLCERGVACGSDMAVCRCVDLEEGKKPVRGDVEKNAGRCAPGTGGESEAPAGVMAVMSAKCVSES